MLIQKSTLTKGDVVVVKLNNHPVEIVARLEEDFTSTSTEIVMRRPLEAHLVQSQSGVGIAFMPFSMTARDDQLFRFATANLLVPPFPARDEVGKSYIEQTTSLKMP